MSGGAIFQEVLRRLQRQKLPDEARRVVLTALQAGRSGPLALLYEAGSEVGLPRPLLLARGVGIYFLFCAANVTDDLIDGECTYYPDPVKAGPCAEFMLLSLAWATLAEAEIPVAVHASAARALAACAAAEVVEMRTREWRAPLYQQVAEGIAGAQYEAYFRFFFAGTPLEERAAEMGRRLAIVSHVAEDIRSRAERFFTLSPEDQNQVVAWAQGLVEELGGATAEPRWLQMALTPIIERLNQHSEEAG